MQSSAVSTGLVDSIVGPIFQNIIQPVVGLIFVIAMLVFVYGIIEMVTKGGDAEAREKGRNHMLYGVIGGTIMISAWGIIWFVANTVKSL